MVRQQILCFAQNHTRTGSARPKAAQGIARLVMCVVFTILAMVAAGHARAQAWDQADLNGEQSRKALLACWRYMQGWLQHADPVTGLIPQSIKGSRFWNAKDAAADNYPFMVLSSYYTDRDLHTGWMLRILETEQRLCNRVDHLPDDWLFETQAFRNPDVNMDGLIFGASEYVKDGLMPVTELLGQTPWSERWIGLLEDIWKNAKTESEVGVVPSTSHEVAGNLLQSCSRAYWMTGDPKFRDWAFTLAAFYFEHHSPIEADQLRLDDHGCEVVGGLAEAYYLASKQDPERHARWRPAMHRILDRILEVGRDEHGLLTNNLNPVTGEWLSEELTDNWGYNYNAFLVVAEVDDAPKYRDAVAFVLGNLLEVKDYAWEKDIADGIADSLEGGLNLLNRIPSPEAAEWADYMAVRLLSKQRDTGVIEGWHGDGNFARTLLMYALWKSQGAYVEPWRADLRVGAVRNGDSWAFAVVADWPWEGKLRFDVPRHADYLHIPDDYARLNQFPEWFTVSASGNYAAGDVAHTAAELREGLPIRTTPEEPFRIELNRKDPL